MLLSHTQPQVILAVLAFGFLCGTLLTGMVMVHDRRQRRRH